MPSTHPVTTLASRPDARILERQSVVHHVCLFAATVIAAGVLGGWLSPQIAAWLPKGWSIMAASSALAVLLAVANLALTGPGHGKWRRGLGSLTAFAVILIAVTTLLGYANSQHVTFDVIWADNKASMPTVPASLQTAVYLMFLGLTLIFMRARTTISAAIVDMFAVCMTISVLVISAGYCFHAARLYGQSQAVQTSVQTLACMALLAFVAIGRRAENGYFAVLIGIGIGSQVARLVLPVALILPFILTVASAYARLTGWLPASYAEAMTAATMAFVFCGVLIVMAWRINALERDLRDMSLTDALTGCYNRHGFSVLSTQALRDARRLNVPLTVLFFDVDNLKQVNDRLGHDAGSRILMDVGRLLRRTFRGADVVARVGGDEFAIVMQGDRHAGNTALERLNDKTRIMNRDGRQPYKIEYSVGMATSADDESLDRLITRADAVMYEQKRRRKVGRGQAPGATSEQATPILADG